MSEENKDQAELDKKAEIENQWKAMPWVIGFFVVLYFLITADWESAEDKKSKVAENKAAMEEYRIFADCELGLKSLLKSPASYQLVKNDTNIGINRGTVNLTYDAENSFRAKLRGNFTCTFKRDKDAVETPKPFYLAGASLNGDDLSIKEIVVLQVEIVRAWLAMR